MIFGPHSVIRHGQFDQIRIPIGDTLVVFRCPNGAKGTGTHNLRHSRLLEPELPAAPSLNSLILEPQSDRPIGEIATPPITLSAQ